MAHLGIIFPYYLFPSGKIRMMIVIARVTGRSLPCLSFLETNGAQSHILSPHEMANMGHSVGLNFWNTFQQESVMRLSALPLHSRSGDFPVLHTSTLLYRLTRASAKVMQSSASILK